MDTNSHGGPAFPVLDSTLNDGRAGMTLRDYFAAHALAGLCGNQHFVVRLLDEHKSGDDTVAAIASAAIGLSDAMLAQRRSNRPPSIIPPDHDDLSW